MIISGAAGATGSMVIQIAKHIVGCKRVNGIAGGESECHWIESLGADVCVDHKTSPERFKEALITATAENASLYFDNFGGEILDLCLTRLRRNGRVCGAVSSYNSSAPTTLKNYFDVIIMRLQFKDFVFMDFLAMDGGKKAKEAVETLVKVVHGGKIKIGEENETLVDAEWEDVLAAILKVVIKGSLSRRSNNLIFHLYVIFPYMYSSIPIDSSTPTYSSPSIYSFTSIYSHNSLCCSTSTYFSTFIHIQRYERYSHQDKA